MIGGKGKGGGRGHNRPVRKILQEYIRDTTFYILHKLVIIND